MKVSNLFRFRFFIVTFFLCITMLFSDEKASIDVNLNFVSNYVWRGHDFFRNYAIQKQKSFGPHSGAWAFQPSITWNTPLEGLYVNLFSSIALQGREDVDVDKRIQTQPSGPFINDRISLLDPNLDVVNDIVTNLPTSGLILNYANTPNFYKELVGLKRNDELDITIGYEKETKVGTIAFGIIHYKYANSITISQPYGTEVFLKYSFPVISNLSISIYEDIRIDTLYYSVDYSGKYDLTKDFSSSYSLSVGYYVLDKVKGISDITLNYTVHHSLGLSFGINVALTPNTQIQEYYWGAGDPINGENFNTKLPIEINGLSSIYDGKIADPSRTLGPVNEYVNSIITNEIANAIGLPYTYTPRQELPKYYWWISIGYSVSFE